MKRKHGFFFGFTVLLLAAMFTAAGCDSPADPSPDDNEDSALAAPTGVKAVALSSNSIRVSWNPVSGASGYYVSRSTGVSPFYMAGTTSATSYTDTGTGTGLIADRTYFYKVTAYDSNDKYGYASEEVYATTLP
jgi:fibronectin type 3 domain-containing protein